MASGKLSASSTRFNKEKCPFCLTYRVFPFLFSHFFFFCLVGSFNCLWMQRKKKNTYTTTTKKKKIFFFF